MHTKWRQLNLGAYEILVYTLKTSLLGCHLTHGLLERMILLNLIMDRSYHGWFSASLANFIDHIVATSPSPSPKLEHTPCWTICLFVS